MALAPGDVLRLKQGSTFPWSKQLRTVMADGTSAPVDLTGKAVTIRMTHARTGVPVVAGSSVVVTNPTLGEIGFTLLPTHLSLLGAHQVTWDVNSTPYPFEGYDVVVVEEKLP